MHSVVQTPEFVAQAKKSGLSSEEIDGIVKIISDDPQGGDLMAGTSGARKVRIAGRGKGKSGGYRTIHYYGGDDIPVFLLTVYGKDEADNLTKAQRNALSKMLGQLGDEYRKGVKRAIKDGRYAK